MPYIISLDVIYNAGGGIPFGSFYGNEIAWTQASAVQNTWYEISDATIVDGGLHNITHDGSGELTVTYAGWYSATAAVGMEADAVNQHIQIGFYVDGTTFVGPLNHFETFGTSKQQAATVTGHLDLSASSTVAISVRTTDAGTPDISVDHIMLKLDMVGGT